MTCFRRVGLQMVIGVCPQKNENLRVIKRKQIDLLETIFIHGTSMCERVSEDSRHGTGHVDIRVGIMNSLEYVCLPLHECWNPAIRKRSGNKKNLMLNCIRIQAV